MGEDTTLSQIIRMVSDAAATKAPIAKAADKVSGVFVPVVMAIAAVTVVSWLASGESLGFALARGISVLVISCPCALGLATPVAIMVGSGAAAKQGVLFKTAAALEETGKVTVVALDKTGTITAGTPKLRDILPAAGVTECELLRFAASLESKSEHPPGLRRPAGAEERGIEVLTPENFRALPGTALRRGLPESGYMRAAGTLSKISSRFRKKCSRRRRNSPEKGKPLCFSAVKTASGILTVAT